MKTSDLQVCLLIQSDTNCNFKFKIRLNERKSLVNQTKKNEIQKKTPNKTNNLQAYTRD